MILLTWLPKHTEVDTEVTEIENEVSDITSFLSTTEAGYIIKDVDSNQKKNGKSFKLLIQVILLAKVILKVMKHKPF